MQIFISWAGPRSNEFAKTLCAYLPQMIQNSQPWMSDRIGKGKTWLTELWNQINSAQFGILCITSENINSPWILFEAGALKQRVDVCPILLNIKKKDIPPPLSTLQLIEIQQQELFQLITDINRIQKEKAVSEEILRKTFDKFWPELEDKLHEIEEKDISPETPRTDSELLEEILDIVRDQQPGFDKGIERALKTDSDTRRAFSEGVKNGIGFGLTKALDNDSDTREAFRIGVKEGIGSGLAKALDDNSDTRDSFKNGVKDGIGDGLVKALDQDSDTREALKQGISQGITKSLDDDSDTRTAFKDGVKGGIGDGLAKALDQDSDTREALKKGVESGIENALRNSSDVRNALRK
jgi:hypothetical protein